MSDLPKLTYRERLVFEMIHEAAFMNKPCPSNAQMLDALQMASISAPVYIVKALEAKGIISVKRYQSGRVATLTASGKSTLPTDTTPHWREGVTC